MTNDFHVEQIDHVELFVPNRLLAANWYHDVLGLKIVEEFKQWADHPGGPLMITTQQGKTKLALFEGSPEGSRKTIGFHLVAFRVGADSFVQFVTQLSELKLTDHRGRAVTPEQVVDHDRAYSIYFSVPHGHHLELTTYEYEQTKFELEKSLG